VLTRHRASAAREVTAAPAEGTFDNRYKNMGLNLRRIAAQTQQSWHQGAISTKCGRKRLSQDMSQ
jgi:hypothetical protein